MPRSRLGVAIVLPEPLRAEILGIRRAVGCPSLDTQPPHLTLVPPVNVRAEEIDDALTLVHAVCARKTSMTLRIGPIETFAPVSPVLYMGVHGPDVAQLTRLRSEVLAGPLYRRISYEYLPHVTVHEAADPELIAAGLVALAEYRQVAVLASVDVLRQDDDRVWRSLASFALGPETVRGRGGIEVSIRESRLMTPSARDLLEDDDRRRGRQTWVLEACRPDGTIVGTAGGFVDDDRCVVTTLLVEPNCRSMGIGNHLLTEILLLAAARSSGEVVIEVPGAVPAGETAGNEVGEWIAAWLLRRAFTRRTGVELVRRESDP
jgi:2'-5' RNA ligase/GNAT superfamily N-acetyltransferase